MKIRDYIAQEVFRERALAHHMLVIYDPKRIYAELLEHPALSGLTVINAGKSVIEAMEVMRDSLESFQTGGTRGLIIWVPKQKPTTPEEKQTDPFAHYCGFEATDQDGFGAHFPKDDGDEFASLCLKAKREHAIALRQLFESNAEPSFDVIDALDKGSAWPSLKTLLKAESPREILIRLLVPSDETREAVDQDASWSTELADFAQTVLGYSLRTKEQDFEKIEERLWTFVLFSEFAHDLRSSLPSSLQTVPHAPEAAAALVNEVCDALRKHQDHSRVYIERAQAIEDSMSLASLGLKAGDLGVRDTFPFEEKLIISEAADLFCSKSRGEALELFQRHKASVWMRDETRLSEWQVAETAMRLIDATESCPRPDDGKLASLISLYVSSWREVDKLARELEQLLQNYDGANASIDNLVEMARSVHLDFIAKGQDAFVGAVEKHGWPARNGGLLSNAEVFDKVVDPLLGAGERVAYLLIDSLRYELAVELEKQLSSTHKVALRPVCAQLPTYTEVGMASLMPSASTALRLTQKGDSLTTFLGGLAAVAPASRFAYLKGKKGDQCADIELDEFLRQKKTKITEKTRLLIVRSREIDAISHQSPANALNVLPDVLRQVSRVIVKLEAAGFTKAVIVTDHGFLLFRDQIAGNTVPRPAGTWPIEKTRCVVGKADPNPTSSSIVFKTTWVGIPSDAADYGVPRNLLPYEKANLYYHEGLSLQECILPCMEVQLRKSKPKLSVPTLQLSYKQGKTSSITSRRPVVDIIWSEGNLFASEQEIELALEIADTAGKVAGAPASGQTFNPATQTIRISPGMVVSVGIRMEDSFEGPFVVRAIDPGTQMLIAELALSTNYTV